MTISFSTGYDDYGAALPYPDGGYNPDAHSLVTKQELAQRMVTRSYFIVQHNSAHSCRVEGHRICRYRGFDL